MNEEQLTKREEQLAARMQRIEELEAQVIKKERALKEKEKAKKQVLLRLAPSLWDEIAARAEDDFPSVYIKPFKKQKFNFAAAALFCAKETGRNNTGIVHNKTVTLVKILNYIIKMLM